MVYNPPFGAWLKQRRKALGLSQDEVARLTHYSVATVRKIEADKLKPSRQLADLLAEAVQIPPAERDDFQAFARGLEQRKGRSNLPIPGTPLIGRAGDIAAVRQLLLQPGARLVTLVGPPGVGKTRLGIAVAEACACDFPDGMCFVPLASIARADTVGSAILAALRIQNAPDRPAVDAIHNFLGDGRFLLILDNFEHLLPAATLVADLVLGIPNLKVLVTSRAVLNVTAERAYDVQPLALPDLDVPANGSLLPASAAVELFIERAQAAKPGFALDRHNAPAVADICCRLDGLPLAIELAASRVRMFTPQTLASRLDHQIGAAIRTLSSGPRDLPARQQTLRAAIDWSYSLLTPEQQRLLLALAVFVNGATMLAAWVVATGADAEAIDLNQPPDVPDDFVADLQALLDHHLARQEAGADGEPRYTMLAMVREYALLQLEARGEDRILRERHARYFARFADAAHPVQLPRYHLTWIKRFRADYDNVHAAMEWMVLSGGDIVARVNLAAAFVFYRCIRRQYWAPLAEPPHLEEWLERVLSDCASALLHCQARALGALAILAWQRGDYQRGCALSEARLCAYQSTGDTLSIGLAMCDLESVPSQERFQQAIALFESIRSPECIAYAMTQLGQWLFYEGQHDKAFAVLERAVSLRRDIGRHWDTSGGIADAVRSLGVIWLLRGQPAKSVALFEEAIAFYRDESGNTCASSLASYYLSHAKLAMDDLVSAACHSRESLRQAQYMRITPAISIALAQLSEIARRLGETRRAAVLAGAAAIHEQEVRNSYHAQNVLSLEFDPILARARSQLNDLTFAAAWAEGQAMAIDQAVAYALENA
jgi:predicted ATPase/transcriptional regulator with XRE-family HTH domain/tetratricopeptide (TPR) repeat protein